MIQVILERHARGIIFPGGLQLAEQVSGFRRDFRRGGVGFQRAFHIFLNMR
ncbi:hypothetical protein D3C80_2066500 [compost metagenome]